jgi:hypothetical protein
MDELVLPVPLCSVDVCPAMATPFASMAISAEEAFFTYQTLPPSPTPRPAVVKFCVTPEIRI